MDNFVQSYVVYCVCVEGVYVDPDWLRYINRVSNLNLVFFGQFCGDEVFGYVVGEVGRRMVYFIGVFF